MLVRIVQHLMQHCRRNAVMLQFRVNRQINNMQPLIRQFIRPAGIQVIDAFLEIMQCLQGSIFLHQEGLCHQGGFRLGVEVVQHVVAFPLITDHH